MALTTAGDKDWVRDYRIEFISIKEFAIFKEDTLASITGIEIKSDDQPFPLEIDFKVSYKDGQGELVLTIKGLSEDTTSKLVPKETVISLFVGHRGKELPLLYTGEIRIASTLRNTKGSITTIKASTLGLSSYPFYANEPEKFDSYLDRIFWVLDVAKAMTGGVLETKEGKEMLTTISEEEINERLIQDRKGASIQRKPLLSFAPLDERNPHSGTIELALRKVLHDHQVTYYLVNNSVLFFKKGMGNPNDNPIIRSAILILGQNLLTVPALDMKNADVNKFDPVKADSYIMKAFLNNLVIPGSVISTDVIREVSGNVENKESFMVVEEVIHTGSNYKKPWYTDIKASLSKGRNVKVLSITDDINLLMESAKSSFKGLDQLTHYPGR